MKKFHLFSVCTLLSLFCISGCGKQVPEMASDFLMEHGEEIVQAIDNGLDAMQEYGAVEESITLKIKKKRNNIFWLV